MTKTVEQNEFPPSSPTPCAHNMQLNAHFVYIEGLKWIKFLFDLFQCMLNCMDLWFKAMRMVLTIKSGVAPVLSCVYTRILEYWVYS